MAFQTSLRSQRQNGSVDQAVATPDLGEDELLLVDDDSDNELEDGFEDSSDDEMMDEEEFQNGDHALEVPANGQQISLAQLDREYREQLKRHGEKRTHTHNSTGLPPFSEISKILRQAAQRPSKSVGGREANRLELSDERGEYTWDDLVAGTDLPAAYFNPEDTIIKIDEKLLVAEEMKEIEKRANGETVARIADSRIQPSKKEAKQGTYFFFFLFLLYIAT
jgi:hypothetical protein